MSYTFLMYFDQNGMMFTASILSFLLNLLHGLPAPAVYAIVGVLVFGESALFIGFVLPGETSVLIGGVISAQGGASIGVLAPLVVLCAIAGDSVGYYLGAKYGEKLFQLPLIRTRSRELESALTGLKRRGPTYVFLGRFTAFLRAVMPGLAGMSKMHYPRFLAANASGGIVWGVTFSLLGYYAGHELKVVEKYSNWAEIALLILTITVVSTLHILRKKREARALAGQ